jgi:hypothetical protein
MITNTKYSPPEPDFPVPLPESVLEKYPELETWQGENKIAWRRWWELLNSPILGQSVATRSRAAWRERIRPVPPFPAPLPHRMLVKFPDLMQWQQDNAVAWDDICKSLHILRSGEIEYGDNVTTAAEASLESVYGIHYKPQNQLETPKEYKNWNNPNANRTTQ